MSLDLNKTYLVWNGTQFPDSTSAQFKAPAGSIIDWGDGESTEFSTETAATHTYDDGKTKHTIVISGLTSIGNSAFRVCRSLNSVTIGNNVTSIGYEAFSYCSSLKSVTIVNSVTSIGNSAFRECRSLKSVTIGNGVTSIGEWSFTNCISLTSVTIGNNVTSIGYGAFWDCSDLTSVTIGNGVTRIDYSVFNNCTKLTQLILFPSTPPTLASDAIPSTIQSIYVQQSSKAAYQKATNWTTFASKIVGDNLYLSFARFNIKNKEYIEKKLNDFKGDKGDKGDQGDSGSSALAVIISAPAAATQGTLTEKQLSTLQASDNNYIVFNNEIYRLADKKHTAGILSYTHTGWNGTAMLDKSINITVSTRAWTLVIGQEGGGTNVVANPGTGTTRITDIQIGNTKYFILPAKYEKYLKDNTFTEPTVILGVSIVTSTVKDGKFLYNQTITVNISHREVKNDATSLNNLTLYWRGSSIQSSIVPSIGTTTTIIRSGSYKLSTSNNKFQLKLPYVADGDSGSVSSYEDIPSGYALWYGAGDAATRLDTTNIKNIVSSGSVNISVETTASQRITIMFPGTVTAKTNVSFSTDVPLTKIGTVSLPVYNGSSGTTILADAVTYNIYQTEPLKAGTNDITLTLGGN